MAVMLIRHPFHLQERNQFIQCLHDFLLPGAGLFPGACGLACAGFAGAAGWA
jgi:hypothetical protein